MLITKARNMRKCPICLSEAVNTNINFLPTTLNKMNEFDTCKISVCSSCKFGYVEQDFDEERLHKYYEEYRKNYSLRY